MSFFYESPPATMGGDFLNIEIGRPFVEFAISKRTRMLLNHF
jgi:hypothetical protein